MTLDLTGLDMASASLLDEATAAAEAMAMAKRVSKLKNANRFFVASDVHPQTLDVVRTRAETFGFDVIVDDAAKALDHPRMCLACCCSRLAPRAKFTITAR